MWSLPPTVFTPLAASPELSSKKRVTPCQRLSEGFPREATVAPELAAADCTRWFGSAPLSAIRAKYATTPPPTIRAAPQNRSVQAQAFKPPTNTYTVAQKAMMMQPTVMLPKSMPMAVYPVKNTEITLAPA